MGQVRCYDPKNRDGPPVDQRGMGGGPPGGPPPPHHHHDAPGNSQMGVGNLGNLGGLGGLGSLAGAAGILGQLGLGGLNGAALSGLGGANNALGGLGGLGLGGNMMGGNDNERDHGGYRGNDSRGGERQRSDDRVRVQRSARGNDNGSRFDADFGDMETETKITMPNDMAGAIIGKGGQRIKEIKQSSGARVDFSETEKGSKAPRVVTIAGTQRQIVIAQQMMAECVQNRT